MRGEFSIYPCKGFKPKSDRRRIEAKKCRADERVVKILKAKLYGILLKRSKKKCQHFEAMGNGIGINLEIEALSDKRDRTDQEERRLKKLEAKMERSKSACKQIENAMKKLDYKKKDIEKTLKDIC